MNAKSAVAVVLSMLAFTLTAAQPRAIEVPLTNGSLISASSIDDDGRGWLAVARPEPWRTDLYRISPEGVTRDASIDGAIVKGIRQLQGRERYFMHGAQANPSGGASAFFRVVSASGGRFTTLWDSSRIPASARNNEHLVTVSSDGSQWAAASFDDRTLRVTFGATDVEKPRTTISVESDPVELPEGFEYDGVGLEFIGNSHVAALWRGRVFVFDGEKVVARFVPPNGGASLAFDPTSSTLWAIGSRSAAAFDVRDVTKTKPAKVTMLGDSGRFAQTFTLTGGRLATSSIERGVLVSDIEDANGNRVRKSFHRSGSDGTLVVSRGGKAILELPQASNSGTVYLHIDR